MEKHRPGQELSKEQQAIVSRSPVAVSFLNQQLRADRPKVYRAELFHAINEFERDMYAVCGLEWQDAVVKPLLKTATDLEVFAPSLQSNAVVNIISALLAMGHQINNEKDAEKILGPIATTCLSRKYFSHNIEGQLYTYPLSTTEADHFISNSLRAGVQLSKTYNSSVPPVFADFIQTLDIDPSSPTDGRGMNDDVEHD